MLVALSKKIYISSWTNICSISEADDSYLVARLDTPGSSISAGDSGALETMPLRQGGRPSSHHTHMHLTSSFATL